jgi:hypothetical protein
MFEKQKNVPVTLPGNQSVARVPQRKSRLTGAGFVMKAAAPCLLEY